MNKLPRVKQCTSNQPNFTTNFLYLFFEFFSFRQGNFFLQPFGCTFHCFFCFFQTQAEKLSNFFDYLNFLCCIKLDELNIKVSLFYFGFLFLFFFWCCCLLLSSSTSTTTTESHHSCEWTQACHKLLLFEPVRICWWPCSIIIHLN